MINSPQVRSTHAGRLTAPWGIRLSALTVVALGIAVLCGYRVNVSRSLPLGLYRTVGDATVISRGSIVVVCLPEEWSKFALQRGVLGAGECPGGTYGLGKIVVATEGDAVVLSADKLSINGQAFDNFRILDRDRAGRVIPHYPWGSYTVGAGEVWLYSPHPLAFDSRYFGPIKVERVESAVLPVLTKRE